MRAHARMSEPEESAAGDRAARDDLVRLALAGDEASWGRLIERHGHRVVLSLLARGMDLDRAKELAQETWLRLIESQRAGRLTTLALPGLAIVQAGYLAANDRRRVAFASEPPDDASPSAEPTIEQRLLDRQRLRRLGRALEACSPGARRVFELVYDHPELGYPEVALRMGLSIQRVKQIVCEVRKRLKAALEESDR